MSIYQIALLSLVFAAVFAVAALVIGWLRGRQQLLDEPKAAAIDREQRARLIRVVTGQEPTTWTSDGWPIASSQPVKRGRRRRRKRRA